MKQDAAAPTLLLVFFGWRVTFNFIAMKFSLGFVRPRQTFFFMVFGDFTSLDEGYHVVPPPSIHAENLQSKELVPEPGRLRSQSGVSVRRHVARRLNCGGEHGLNVCGAMGVVGMVVVGVGMVDTAGKSVL